MFRLDDELRGWRRRLIASHLFSRKDVEELESHLLEHFDVGCARGLDEAQAFAAAVQAMGSSQVLQAEFARAHVPTRMRKLRNRLSFVFNREVVMRVLVGLVVGLSFVSLGVVLEGGNFSLLTQLTALLIVGGGSLGALLMTYSLPAILAAFRLAITGNEATQREYHEASLVFKSFGDFAILANFLSLCLGAVHVAEHAHRSPESIGLGLAVCFVAAVYGVGIKMFVAKPMQDRFHALASIGLIREGIPRGLSQFSR